ncbi:MAG: TauD/TfdA family dioxygenase [bacterium]|nr:TauD/TfdA family dioxygenase [bacterium]
MHVTPLDAPFGAQLHLETDDALGPEEVDVLRRAFAEHGFLLVREGPIDDARQIELLAALGRVEPDESGAPMRMEVTNQHDETTAPEGELVFHCDYAYDPAPIPVISLYGATIDGDVTPTCFASGASVLDRLAPETVERLRDLTAVHACFLYRHDAPDARSEEPDPLIPRGEPGWGPAHYWHHHAAILENAFGVETLFVCLQHTDRFEGLPRTVSDGLLEELFAALYAPDAIYEHRWQPHDLLIWDNLTIQHARPEPIDRPRTLRRYHVSETDLTADYVRVAREQGIM